MSLLFFYFSKSPEAGNPWQIRHEVYVTSTAHIGLHSVSSITLFPFDKGICEVHATARTIAKVKLTCWSLWISLQAMEAPVVRRFVIVGQCVSRPVRYGQVDTCWKKMESHRMLKSKVFWRLSLEITNHGKIQIVFLRWALLDYYGKWGARLRSASSARHAQSITESASRPRIFSTQTGQSYMCLLSNLWFASIRQSVGHTRRRFIDSSQRKRIGLSMPTMAWISCSSLSYNAC